jgi:hypothetical protein
MVESGAALAVMGNHEYNAITYYTQDSSTGNYLRPHSEKNSDQHIAFLKEYQNATDEYEQVIAWFKTLPLWLDLGGLRVVHACWSTKYIDLLTTECGMEAQLTDDLLEQSSYKGSPWQYTAIETLVKGKVIPLPNGQSFKDKDGNTRHHIRVKWWDNNATTYKSAFLGQESVRTHIPEDDTGGDHLIEYAHNAPPVFLGHYWMEGEPEPLAQNIACLDFSIANKDGKGVLVAYRWDGEQVISKGKFIWVERDPGDVNILPPER